MPVPALPIISPGPCAAAAACDMALLPLEVMPELFRDSKPARHKAADINPFEAH